MERGFEKPTNYEEWSKSLELARTFRSNFCGTQFQQNRIVVCWVFEGLFGAEDKARVAEVGQLRTLKKAYKNGTWSTSPTFFQSLGGRAEAAVSS